MDRQTFLNAIQAGSVRVRFRDGSLIDITPSEGMIVSDFAAHILYCDSRGRYQTQILALRDIDGIEPISDAA